MPSLLADSVAFTSCLSHDAATHGRTHGRTLDAMMAAVTVGPYTRRTRHNVRQALRHGEVTMSDRKPLHIVRGTPGVDAAPPTSDERGAALSRDLIASARGDERAFERLYDSIGASVFGVALRIVRDRAMAEEVAQESLVEVWRIAARYRPDRGSARAWILTIAHRRAVDRVRSEQAHANRVQAHGQGFESTTDGPDEVVDVAFGAWEAERVRIGLGLLTPRQREALELTYFKGYTNKELAESLGIPLGTAKARIRDGLIKLRDAWEVEQ